MFHDVTWAFPRQKDLNILLLPHQVRSETLRLVELRGPREVSTTPSCFMCSNWWRRARKMFRWGNVKVNKHIDRTKALWLAPLNWRPPRVLDSYFFCHEARVRLIMKIWSWFLGLFCSFCYFSSCQLHVTVLCKLNNFYFVSCPQNLDPSRKIHFDLSIFLYQPNMNFVILKNRHMCELVNWLDFVQYPQLWWLISVIFKWTTDASGTYQISFRIFRLYHYGRLFVH